MAGIRPTSSQSTPPSHFSATEGTGKHVQELNAPLSSSWYSPNGLLEMAWRVRLLFLLLLIPVAYFGYRRYQEWSSQIPSNPPNLPPKGRRLDFTSPGYTTPFSPFKGQAPRARAGDATSTPEKPPRLSLASPGADSAENLIEIDVQEIDDKFKDLVENLDQLPDQMPMVEELCFNFTQNHGEHSRYSDLFEIVDSRWTRLSFLHINYTPLWTHYVAGRQNYLFDALFQGLSDFHAGMEPPSELTNSEQLRHLILKKMKEMITEDEKLQKLTDCAIFALSTVLEFKARIEMDRLYKEKPLERQKYLDVGMTIEKFLKIKDHSATTTSPAYFDYMENGELKFGSINAIYVFSKLFPNIRIAVPHQDGSLDCELNPGGSYYLQLGVGEQKEFIYVRHDPEERSV